MYGPLNLWTRGGRQFRLPQRPLLARIVGHVSLFKCIYFFSYDSGAKPRPIGGPLRLPMSKACPDPGTCSPGKIFKIYML